MIDLDEGRFEHNQQEISTGAGETAFGTGIFYEKNAIRRFSARARNSTAYNLRDELGLLPRLCKPR